MHTSTLYAILCLAVGVAPSFALPSGGSALHDHGPKKKELKVPTGEGVQLDLDNEVPLADGEWPPKRNGPTYLTNPARGEKGRAPPKTITIHRKGPGTGADQKLTQNLSSSG
ncbi:hypothetical protein F5148DRAFT_1149553 [Russula earlei]|uniref:Uncharacterized protein n=1 Tax=Russula earlei TaxID=71964 RepID=A0ACC0U7Q7_9AGAM|nr:hypothetical protein F5148DRAFT_1149553 [Russula earlei]